MKLIRAKIMIPKKKKKKTPIIIYHTCCSTFIKTLAVIISFW